MPATPRKLWLFFQVTFKSGGGGRTGLVVRASDSGSGDPGSILGRVGVLFLEQETFTPQKYWQYQGIGGSVSP